ncbi:MAG: protein kinase [Pirellulales bacterium]|nr:protein kinase [Pirellulales bacterium]
MSVTIADFWHQLEQSRLISGEHCRQLAEQFGELKGVARQGNATVLAEWLVNQQALTRYQAKILLRGKSGPFFFGEYVLFEKISAGRLEGLYRALHLQSRHPVLLEFLEPGNFAEPQQRAALAEYTQFAANWLGHPHLLDLYQLARAERRAFVVYADCAGDTLDQVLQKSGPLPSAEACRLVRGALLGLAVQHQLGLVHGAIRPANLLLAHGGLVPTLLVPPLARDTWPDPAKADLSAFTPEQFTNQVDYMAPELARPGQTANILTDIYACGCLLYHSLAGRPPFAGGDLGTKFVRHASEPVQPLEPLGVPPQLAQVVAYAMAKDPGLRYTQAGQLAEALSYFVDPRALQIPLPAAPASRVAYLSWLGQQPRVDSGFVGARVGGSGNDNSSAGGALATLPNLSPQLDFGAAMAAVTNKQSPPGAPGVPLGDPASAGPSIFEQQTARREQAFRKQLFIAGGILGLVIITTMIVLSLNRDQPTDTPTEKNPSTISQQKTQPEPAPTVSPTTQSPMIATTGQDPLSGDPGTATPPATSPPVNTTPPVQNTSVIPGEPDRPLEISSPPTNVADDGNSLWASPTNGTPLNFSQLPAGAQLFFSCRPAFLLRQTRVGPKMVAAAGPLVAAGLEELRQITAVPVDELQLVQIAWVDGGNRLLPVVYARAAESMTKEKWLAALRNPAAGMEGSEQVYHGPAWSYHFPLVDGGKKIIIAPVAQLRELLTAPALPLPKMERLLKTSDAERGVNLLFAPNLLFSEGARFFPGQEPLLKFFADVLGYDTEALGLSLHVAGTDFFVEAKFRPSAGQSAAQGALLYREKIRNWQSAATAFINTVLPKNPQQYAFALLMKFPERVGMFSRFTRTGEENGLIVVRTYLNSDAAEHMVYGSELSMAYAGLLPTMTTGGTSSATQPGTTGANVPVGNTAAAKLQKVITLNFARDTLEKSMEMLSTEIGVPIEILGADLQLEGITKNQSFGLDEKDKTAEQILLTIFLKANPDGKLVYVIKTKEPGGVETIFITTRAAAAKRQEKLPAALDQPAKNSAKKGK